MRSNTVAAGLLISLLLGMETDTVAAGLLSNLLLLLLGLPGHEHIVGCSSYS